MRESLFLLAIVFLVLLGTQALIGADGARALGFGVVAAMAAMIAATFLWLWRTRATPLALGMAFSWAGTATLLGWLWVYHWTGRPEAMDRSLPLLVFLSLHVTGAVHHFAVLQRTMKVSGVVFALPMAVVTLLGVYSLARM